MCFNINNPRDMTISQLHNMATVDLLEKRRMLQLMSIMYDIAPASRTNRPDVALTHNTRLANKSLFEIKIANTQLYSKSAYCVGGKFWNSLPKLTQELRTKKQFKRAIVDIL